MFFVLMELYGSEIKCKFISIISVPYFHQNNVWFIGFNKFKRIFSIK